MSYLKHFTFTVVVLFATSSFAGVPAEFVRNSRLTISSIAESARKSNGQGAEARFLFKLELSKLNNYLAAHGPFSKKTHEELRKLIVAISRDAVFNHSNRRVAHNLHVTDDPETRELLHNLVALVASEIDLKHDHDKEFHARIYGLAVQFRGSAKVATGDAKNYDYSDFVVENNHPFTPPAEKVSIWSRISTSAKNAIAALTRPTSASVVPTEPVVELTPALETAADDILDLAVAKGVVELRRRVNVAHPETDRFGKVTLCGRFLEPQDMNGFDPSI